MSADTDSFGECCFTALDRGTKLRIDRADPRVRISGSVVRLALGRGLLPGSELTGDRLVIHGVNQKVIYRVGAYHEDGDWYEAEWPD